MLDQREGANVRSRQRWTLLAVCMATFMLLLDITIVNVALPSIARSLHAGLGGLQWVVDAYALSLASLLLTAGALADRLGRRAVFCSGVALFTAASLGCGLANGTVALDLSRAAQGIGGAAMFATALALIAQEFHGQQRAGALAAWGATVGAGVAVGPLAGGVLTDVLDWRWIFLVNLPIGAATIAIAMLRIGESRSVARGVDVPGLATFSGALLLLVLALLRGNADGWASGPIAGELVGAVVLLAAFVAVERAAADPMLDLSLFRRRSFVGVSLSVFCLGAGMFALITFLSIYLQTALAYSPLSAGLRLLPMTVFVFIVPLALRRLHVHVPAPTAIALGMGAVAAGLVVMRGTGGTTSWAGLVPGLVLAGLGIGLANPAIGAAAVAVVEPARAGMASGFNNTCRLGGIAVGIAGLGAVYQHALTSSGTAAAAYDAAMDDLFLVGAATVAAGAFAAVLLIRQSDLAHAPAATASAAGEAAG